MSCKKNNLIRESAKANKDGMRGICEMVNEMIGTNYSLAHFYGFASGNKSVPGKVQKLLRLYVIRNNFKTAQANKLIEMLEPPTIGT